MSKRTRSAAFALALAAASPAVPIPPPPAAAQTDLFAQMTEEQIQYMLSRIPMGRFVQVQEIAALICWLCTEECAFSTGAVFDVSGGRATY